jgi:hypothetical protein
MKKLGGIEQPEEISETLFEKCHHSTISMFEGIHFS